MNERVNELFMKPTELPSTSSNFDHGTLWKTGPSYVKSVQSVDENAEFSLFRYVVNMPGLCWRSRSEKRHLARGVASKRADGVSAGGLEWAVEMSPISRAGMR
nr:unnamed protein product [Callosobruchus analis]